MCNINFVINKKGRETEVITHLINVMTHASFKSNKDGDGAVFFNKKGMSTLKSDKKILYTGKHRAIISHQRWGTSGTKEAINAHPHIGKRFILIHNGVFSNMGDSKLCDSIEFLNKLEEKVGDTKEIYQPIKEYVSEVSGSFSVFLYDMKYKKLYYFKEKSTNMFCVENDEWLVMSTKDDNVLFANWFLGINQKDSLSVEHEEFYEVKDNGEFDSWGKITKKEISYYGNNSKSSYSGGAYGYYSYGYQKPKTYEEICEEHKDVIQQALDYIKEEKENGK